MLPIAPMLLLLAASLGMASSVESQCDAPQLYSGKWTGNGGSPWKYDIRFVRSTSGFSIEYKLIAADQSHANAVGQFAREFYEGTWTHNTFEGKGVRLTNNHILGTTRHLSLHFDDQGQVHGTSGGGVIEAGVEYSGKWTGNGRSLWKYDIRFVRSTSGFSIEYKLIAADQSHANAVGQSAREFYEGTWTHNTFEGKGVRLTNNHILGTTRHLSLHFDDQCRVHGTSGGGVIEASSETASFEELDAMPGSVIVVLLASILVGASIITAAARRSWASRALGEPLLSTAE